MHVQTKKSSCTEHRNRNPAITRPMRSFIVYVEITQYTDLEQISHLYVFVRQKILFAYHYRYTKLVYKLLIVNLIDTSPVLYYSC